MKTIRLTMAQAVVRYLAAQHVERDGAETPFFAGMWGIFGHGNVAGIGQALAERPDLLTYYRPQNEQAMVHTAIAYTRLKNRLQTYACTSSIGPGATNMITGAATATVNRLPVLLLPGDIFASRRADPVLQQLEYPLSLDVSVNDAFRPVSKFWDRINRPEQLLASLPEALRVLTDPAETGAVTVSLPQDVQAEAYDYPTLFFDRRVWRMSRAVAPPSVLDDAARLIQQAQRPVVVTGGGVIYSEATAALSAFATALGIPVVETQAGKGALPWNHPLNLGPIGSAGGTAANVIARDADLVIAVGTRLADFTTASHTAFQHPDVKFVAINVAARDAAKFAALPVVSDARTALEALTDRLTAGGYTVPANYADEAESQKSAWDRIVSDLRAVTEPATPTQANVIGIVNDALGPRDVMVCAAGSMPGDLLKLWRPEDPKGYHVEYGFSCMGYEIAGGLGAKMAAPDREVVVMVGDGSYLLMNSEIVTAIAEGVKLIIVVVDNHGFQSIHGLQLSTGSPSFGNELRFRDPATGQLNGPPVPINFAANAASLGAVSTRVRTADELRAALAAAKAEPRTSVIEITLENASRMPGFESWWDVPIAAATDDPEVAARHAEYEAARERQRVFV